MPTSSRAATSSRSCSHARTFLLPAAAGKQGEGGQGEQSHGSWLGDGGGRADQVEFTPADVAVLDVAGGLELNGVDGGGGCAQAVFHDRQLVERVGGAVVGDQRNEGGG